MGLLDVNRLSEDILIPVFVEVYGYTDLVNLNTLNKTNLRISNSLCVHHEHKEKLMPS